MAASCGASCRPRETFGALPEPVLPDLSHPFGMLVAGVGGTGVVTIGALLGVAAHLEGKSVSGPPGQGDRAPGEASGRGCFP